MGIPKFGNLLIEVVIVSIFGDVGLGVFAASFSPPSLLPE